MSLLIEAIGGIIASICIATGYKLYKRLKKKSLCFLKYLPDDGLYVIRNDKEEYILKINIDKITEQVDSLKRKISILEKSKKLYQTKKLRSLVEIQQMIDNDKVVDDKENKDVKIDIIE